MRERPTDIRLEQNDDREYEVRNQIPNQPVCGFEVGPPRSVEQRDEHAAAKRHLHGTRATNEFEHFVDEHRYDEDVDEVPPSYRWAAQE